jgi:ESS family glutamate:Na+ symporter
MLTLNLVHTVAFGGVVLFIGYVMRWAVPVLARYNLPAPVLGGLLVSLAVLAARQWNVVLFQFDMTLRDPLMIAFFTTIGFGASLSLLRSGGPQVLLFLVLCTIAAVLQNVAGAAVAVLTGQPPLFGVLCGSVTLTGGPATGMAFAPQFEAAGVTGAGPIAVAASMMGIVGGGLAGAPIGTMLIERLKRRRAASEPAAAPAAAGTEAPHPAPSAGAAADTGIDAYLLLKSVAVLLVAMWAGSWVSAGITALGVTLPAYIGAMLVAAAIRNLDDVTGWLGLSHRVLEEIGIVALLFFLVLAMMALQLWLLAAVALPLIAVLLVQLALVAAYCFWPIFRHMGRDHDAAVMAGGFCGFMMGTTANAMANMDALTQRYGPAPRAFLVVPMVGAFFIDFVNAILIQGCLNIFS